MSGSLLNNRQVGKVPVREPAPTQLNTANYGNFLKVRKRRAKEESYCSSSEVEEAKWSALTPH